MEIEKNYTTEKLVDSVILGMQEIKAENILVLNLKKIESSFCDYFVICDAESSTQVDAIANSVEVTVKKELNDKLLHKEGFENASWILLDFSDVIVHVFQKSSREFYDLEGFWADAEKKIIE
ncbi:MAG: ribosome silencing factor [Bacteroidales bacterium]|nr:ribosome silencing factor [Bacteroidales bacterium]MBN2755820.1 ribosome silencing factor [Bacteroidales bacterium]